jgi:hypothetical protein
MASEIRYFLQQTLRMSNSCARGFAPVTKLPLPERLLPPCRRGHPYSSHVAIIDRVEAIRPVAEVVAQSGSASDHLMSLSFNPGESLSFSMSCRAMVFASDLRNEFI